MTDEGNITDADIMAVAARTRSLTFNALTMDEHLDLVRAVEQGFRASRVHPAGEVVSSGPTTGPNVAQKLAVERIQKAGEILAMATVASCGCLTKTPDPQYHQESCTYRRICAAMLVLDMAKDALASPAPSYADAIRDIAAERERQTAKEGWSPAHDDEHDAGELAIAAACYIAPNVFPPATVPHHYESTGSARYGDDMAPMTRPVGSVEVPSLWPWDGQWWKPTDRRRNLVKAGALIAAEIDRLDRIEALTPGSPL